MNNVVKGKEASFIVLLSLNPVVGPLCFLATNPIYSLLAGLLCVKRNRSNGKMQQVYQPISQSGQSKQTVGLKTP